MAACSFGATGFKLTNLNLASVKPKLSALYYLRTDKLSQCGGLLLTKSRKTSLHCRCSTVEAETVASPTLKSDDSPTKIVSSETASPLIPNSYEVESLLTEICDTTSIAEVDLKLGGFHLYVKRDLTGPSTSTSPPPPVSNPVDIQSSVEVVNSNGSVSSPSLAITKSSPPSDGIQKMIDKAADEGLIIIQSPRVGYFRRSRTIKGKRAPPSCKEKQQVKEGQVICYIEQLGGELPVESDVSGEVIKILQEDGAPVGYGDPLISILPSFPGIKKLQ